MFVLCVSFAFFFAVNVGLSVAMWISIVPNVPILPLGYLVSPPCYYWVYYGLQLAAGSIPLRRHLGLLGQDFPNRINLLCETVYKKAVKRLYGLLVLKKAGMSTGDLVLCTARLYDLP